MFGTLTFWTRTKWKYHCEQPMWSFWRLSTSQVLNGCSVALLWTCAADCHYSCGTCHSILWWHTSLPPSPHTAWYLVLVLFLFLSSSFCSALFYMLPQEAHNIGQWEDVVTTWGKPKISRNWMWIPLPQPPATSFLHPDSDRNMSSVLCWIQCGS